QAIVCSTDRSAGPRPLGAAGHRTVPGARSGRGVHGDGRAAPVHAVFMVAVRCPAVCHDREYHPASPHGVACAISPPWYVIVNTLFALGYLLVVHRRDFAGLSFWSHRPKNLSLSRTLSEILRLRYAPAQNDTPHLHCGCLLNQAA